MNIGAYKDGYKKGVASHNLSMVALKRAVKDCEEMGWQYLKAYMQGKLDGYKSKEETLK